VHHFRHSDFKSSFFCLRYSLGLLICRLRELGRARLVPLLFVEISSRQFFISVSWELFFFLSLLTIGKNVSTVDFMPFSKLRTTYLLLTLWSFPFLVDFVAFGVLPFFPGVPQAYGFSYDSLEVTPPIYPFLPFVHEDSDKPFFPSLGEQPGAAYL